MPLFGTLIGLEFEKQLVLGACRFPALNEVVYARQGEGAWWQDGNGRERPAHVSPVIRLSDALLCITTISGFQRIGRYETFEKVRSAVKLTRGWGDCYGHALVATGRAGCDDRPADESLGRRPVYPHPKGGRGAFLRLGGAAVDLLGKWRLSQRRPQRQRARSAAPRAGVSLGSPIDSARGYAADRMADETIGFDRNGITNGPTGPGAAPFQRWAATDSSTRSAVCMAASAA